MEVEIMPATSADVARHAGVSRATVSQVLNGHADRFAPETAQKVLDAASSLDYRPSAAGRALRRGSSDFVIALIPNTTFGTNLQELFERMGEDLAQHGYTLVLRLASSSPTALDRVVTTMKPSAVFSLAPFTDGERDILSAQRVLAIDPPNVSHIDYNRAIGEMQATILIHHGRERIAYAHLQDSRQDPFGRAREDGVRGVAGEHGLSVEVIHTAIHPESALAALDALGPGPVAIACYNDDVALAMIYAARVSGRSIPEDVAVIGMDHTAMSRLSVPALTTIEYDLAAAADVATLSLLHSLGAGAPVPTAAPPALTLIPGETL